MEMKLVDHEWLEININSIKVKTLQEFFNKYVLSKRVQYKLLSNRLIYIDSVSIIDRNKKLEGDCMRLKVYENEHVDYNCQCIYFPLKILYEDDFLLIVNKPSGINVHSCGNGEVTLRDWVNHYCISKQIPCKPHPIHRLDKETRGLIIFSKSYVFQPLFDAMIATKIIKREYIAIVKGYMKKGYRTVFTESIGKDKKNSNKRGVDFKGQKAITHIESLYTDRIISIVRCVLDTGRTHQIRVHLSYHNYPILNDPYYGIKSNRIKGMGLYSYDISFVHPLNERELHISLGMNEIFNQLRIEENII